MMSSRKVSVFVVSLFLAQFLAFAQSVSAPAAQSNPDVEKRVDSLLSQLTLDEKIKMIGGSITPKAGNLSVPVTVSFDVKNTGDREGAEVAELYVGEPRPSLPRPVEELKGFAKVNLKPGETRRVSLKLDGRAFSFYDVKKNAWNHDAGEFTILVGGSSDHIQLQDKLTLTE